MYTHILLPPGKIPSEVDRQKLTQCTSLGKVEFGVDQVTEQSAVRFVKEKYDRAYRTNEDVHQVIEGWKAAGALIDTDLVTFSLPPTALHFQQAQPATDTPKKSKAGKGRHSPDAQESWAKMQVGGARATVERFKDFGTTAKVALMTLPVIGAAIIGGKTACDLQEKSQRRKTIQDVIDDPMGGKPKAEIDPQKAAEASRPDSFEGRVKADDQQRER